MSQTLTDPDLPAVGSIWVARDGRRFQVEGWTRPVRYPDDDYWANVTLLNPARGMRRHTTFVLRRFGTFLQPIGK